MYDAKRIEQAIQKLVTKIEFEQRTAQLDEQMDRLVTKQLFVQQIDRLDDRIDSLSAQLDKEVKRLDKRIEIVVGEAEDRLIGKMAEMESRIMRHVDARFDELMMVIAQSHQQLTAAIAEVAARPY